MLALDLGPGQGLGQPQARRLVGQGAILPHPALNLAGGGRQAGDVPARGGQPVHGDVVIGAEVERLGGDLGVAVEQERVELADRAA